VVLDPFTEVLYLVGVVGMYSTVHTTTVAMDVVQGESSY